MVPSGWTMPLMMTPVSVFRTGMSVPAAPDCIARLSSDGRARAIRTAEILRGAMESFGREPLRKLVENTWRALGGPGASLAQIGRGC